MNFLFRFAVVSAGLFASLCIPAQAALRYKIYENAQGNLTIQTEGSLTVPTSSYPGYCSQSGAISFATSLPFVCTGTNPGANIPGYPISGPSSFSSGSGSFSPATSVSGLTTAIFPSLSQFVMDSSYVSGAPIASDAIFVGKTLANFGLTPSSGNLGVWTVVGTGDTIRVDVVPGPLPVLGAGAAFGFSRKLRRRIQLSQSAR
jgi:hypothetical protein